MGSRRKSVHKLWLEQFAGRSWIHLARRSRAKAARTS